MPAYAFKYHDYSRWSGPWDNPNEYGLLMAVGLALAAGAIFHNRERRRIDSLVSAVLFVSLILITNGLIHSYSRGSWVGAICGLAYLIFPRLVGVLKRVGRRVRANIIWTTIVITACVIL